MIRLFETDESWRSLVQRAVLGAVMLPHGLQKLLGWFGGPGFDASTKFLAQATHLPVIFGVLAVLAESLGAIALIAGLFTRVSAAGVSAIMIGAVLSTHLANGFFMNWFGNQPGEGFEYHLLVLALAIPLIVTGGGRYALDRVIARVWHRGPEPLAPAAHAA
jgi:putative oxidoreductase